MPAKVVTANFGASNAGLSTVGYAIYKEDESVQLARTTSGVSELGTATGIYRATINYPIQFRGFILWDTGEGSPQYAAESINPLDADSVADEVRTMLRSLNTSLSSHLERLLGNKKSKTAEAKDEKEFERIVEQLKEIKDKIGSLYGHVSKEIGEIDFSPEFKPEINMNTARIESLIGDLKKDILVRNDTMRNLLQIIQSNLDSRIKSIAGEIRKNLTDNLSEVRSMESKTDSKLSQKFSFINGVIDSLTKEMLADMTGEISKLTSELLKVMNRLEQKSRAEETLDTLIGAMKAAPVNGKRISMDLDTRKLLMGLYK